LAKDKDLLMTFIKSKEVRNITIKARGKNILTKGLNESKMYME